MCVLPWQKRAVSDCFLIALLLNTFVRFFYPTVNHHLIEILWLKIDIGHALYFVACAYHPPNPKYPPVDFLTELMNGIDSVISSYPSSTIVIAGDFNQLDTSRLNTDYGLLLQIEY